MKLVKSYNLSVEVPLNASFCEEALNEINITTTRCEDNAINLTIHPTSQNSLSTSEVVLMLFISCVDIIVTFF